MSEQDLTRSDIEQTDIEAQKADTDSAERALRETSEEATQSADTKKIRRVRLKSPRLQLQVTLQRMEKLAQSNTLKEAKAADLLMSMADLQKMLLSITLDEQKDATEAEHAALVAQHAADSERIAELEATITALKSHRCESRTVTVPDPEHDKIRRECETLKNVVKFLAAIASNKERATIRAIQELPAESASIVCQSLGVNYREFLQYLRTYQTERDLLSVIEKAQVEDSSLLRFCRGSLAVNYQVALPEPRSRLTPSNGCADMTAEEKLDQAKRLTGTKKER